MYFLAMFNFIGIFPPGDAKNDLEISEKVLSQHFLHFSGPIYQFSKDNTPVIDEKYTKSCSNSIKNFSKILT